MNVSLVVTAVGADRPGLVDAIAEVAIRHDANWEASRMSRMAGRFAGIILFSVSTERAQALEAALGDLQERGLRTLVERSESPGTEEGQPLRLELVGHDRPGLVHQVTHALAAQGVNVDELTTEVSSAPMTGEPLFRLEATVRVPPALEVATVREVLEDLAGDLVVEVRVDSEPG